MTSSTHTLTEVNQRLETLERSNRRLKKSLIALGTTMAVMLVMGAKMGMNDGYFRNITAGSVTIIDKTGKELVTIGKQDDLGSGIRIYNDQGKRVVGIGISADQRGSGMLVADNNGVPRFGLGMDGGVPSIAITDGSGNKIMALGGNEQGYGLVIMDEKEVERAAIGYKMGNSGVAIFNDKVEYLRGMVQRADGSHFTSYVNPDGKEVMAK